MDYARIVEDIRSFLQATDQTLTDRLRQLADEYAKACGEANRRLRRCEEYLHKGLRSEAIQLSQAEPDLLDVVAILDFSERSQWEELISTYGMTEPPTLLLATAEALNEAYTSVQPIDQLLRKHRLLALSRAPLPARTAVLRQLARIDPTNGVWSEDVREFEAVKVRQLESELQDALDQDDSHKIDRILGEVRDTEWMNAPPLHLIQRVDAAARRRKKQLALDALRTIENELHEAVGANDVDRVKALRNRWHETAARGEVSLKDPLWNRVAPAFEWLNTQQRRLLDERESRATIAKLEGALKDGASVADLDKLHRRLITTNGGIPEDLQGRYQTQRESLRIRTARRRRWLIAAGVLGTFVIGGTIFGAVRNALLDSRIRTTLLETRMLQESGALAHALRHLDAAMADNPSIANTPDLLVLRKRLQDDLDKEQNRLGRFGQAIEDARRAPFDDQGDAVFELARILARLPPEHAEVRKLAKDRQQNRETLTLQQRKAARANRDRLRDKIAELEQTKEESPGAARITEKLRKLQEEVNELKSLREIPSEEMTLLNELSERLTKIDKTLSQAESEATAASRLDREVRSLGNGESYAKALRQYVAAFPNSPRSRAFETVLREMPLWTSVVRWNYLMRSSADRPLNVKPDEARGMAEGLDGLHKAVPNLADAGVADKYLRCVQAIAERDENNSTSAGTQLRKRFTDRFVKNLWVIEADNKKYYIREDAELIVDNAKRNDSRLLSLPCLKSDGTDTKRGIIVKDIKRAYKAPQSVVADAVLGMRPHFAHNTWERATVHIAQMLRESKDIDPIIQLDLLKDVLTLASKGSYPLELELKKHIQFIAESAVDTSVPWMDIENKSVVRIRPQAADVVKRLPPLTPALEQAERMIQNIESDVLKSQREVAGWLAWDKVSGWECRSSVTMTGERRIYVVAPGAENRAEWNLIGTYTNGVCQIDTNSKCLLDGRLVFATRPNPR